MCSPQGLLFFPAIEDSAMNVQMLERILHTVNDSVDWDALKKQAWCQHHFFMTSLRRYPNSIQDTGWDVFRSSLYNYYLKLIPGWKILREEIEADPELNDYYLRHELDCYDSLEVGICSECGAKILDENEIDEDEMYYHSFACDSCEDQEGVLHVCI
jgi:hypothetical protein